MGTLHDNTVFKITSTTLASSASTLLLAAFATRWYLMIQNTGTGRLVVTFDSTAASASAGIILDPASAAGGQGGSWEWSEAIPTNNIYCYSAAGTTVAITEGR